jgi:hypothetical protein
LDIRYLQKKTGGTISKNLLINWSLDIQTSFTLPIGNIATVTQSKQNLIENGDLSIAKIDRLQTTLTKLDELTSSHKTQICRGGYHAYMANTTTETPSFSNGWPYRSRYCERIVRHDKISSNDTEITALQGKLDIEEPKTTALLRLTSSHTTQISSNDTDITALQGRLDIEEPKTTAVQILTSSNKTQISWNDTDKTALQGRLYIEEPKTTALQILTSSNKTQMKVRFELYNSTNDPALSKRFQKKNL